MAIFNKDELILDRVRSLVAKDLSDGAMLMRLTSLENPTLGCTAEGEEVVDAVGSLITTMYRAKKGTFSADNSLVSLGLAAAQYGAKKEVASSENKVRQVNYEVITIPTDATTVTLKHVPVGTIPYIYSIANGETVARYAAGAVATDDEFVMGDNGVLTLPLGLTGKVYVDYEYETDRAVRVVNRATEFPSACELFIFAYFRDKCNENLVYSGVIHCPKAKLNPEQVELALTSTGKHSFTFDMLKDYCAEEGDDMLFEIIVDEQ